MTDFNLTDVELVSGSSFFVVFLGFVLSSFPCLAHNKKLSKVSLMLMREMSKGYSKSKERRAYEIATANGIDVTTTTKELDGLSKWAPYLRVLPRTVPLTIFYNKRELAATEDAQLSKNALNKKKKLKEQYQQLKKQVRTI